MAKQVIQDQSILNATSTFAKFWQNIKAITEPYWYPTKPGGRAFSDVIRAWGMMTLLIVLIMAVVGLNAFNSFVSNYLVDVIIEKEDFTKFVETLAVFALGLLLVTLLVGFVKFLTKRIALDWYEWLNDWILEKYFSERAYYRINFKSDLDNPDQRLSQEIEPITSNALNFLATSLEKVLEMGTFIVILWSISQLVALILVGWTIVGNLIGIYLTQELNKINQEELELKANYNYAITHVRNHAESIAFFKGESQEINIIDRRFNSVLNSAKRKIDWERSTEIFNRGYQAAIQVFTFIILGPLYFNSDDLTFGQVGQACLAANLFANALGELIRQFGTSGRFSSYVERLSEFSEALEEVTKNSDNLSTIKILEDNHLAFENVTLQTPNYEQVIVENLSLTVTPGAGLLIVGPSGRGKSSLLRAIAGLWSAGTGILLRPPLEEVLFLPQRPYIILGTLREQLLYPNEHLEKTDTELIALLQTVNLQNLLSRVDGFDTEMPWENMLSLGEQQRLAFARVLVTRPRFTILDEATSALDLNNENNLYQQLQASQTTFISVGHRESIFDYHQWVLELSQDSHWQLLTVQDYRRQKAKEMMDISADNSQITIDISSNEQSPLKPEIVPLDHPQITIDIPSDEQSPTEPQPEEIADIVSNKTIVGLSHTQMKALTNYSLSTIRSRASLGKSIKATDGCTYYYNKDKNVLKWFRV
ncbi:ABC transporter ATP-binding protein/permease [Aphanothece sacrum]|uniref:ABC transporter n=1 Tax=Aphanothece sacrum FPU1 TaxID=1920663 RepID=A0A401IJY1_APHSA|nr:ATP-binding cassette domain-containing protein [Aphanothece sacrum]GBF81612.1 ABC transporter [Aphanothece sacrum FPU1]GBF84130.1 ABC transporter [Aphanothece sacrum FPU3]